jgi:hypothetical protein
MLRMTNKMHFFIKKKFFFREILIYNININESQNRRDEQCTNEENENFDLSSALSTENNSQKSAGKYISITYIFIHIHHVYIVYTVVCMYYIHFPGFMRERNRNHEFSIRPVTLNSQFYSLSFSDFLQHCSHMSI